MRSTIKRRLGAVLLAASHAWALAAGTPAAPQVVAGQAGFSQQGKVFSITNTPGTIINWDSFNVGAGEVTRFIQQSGDSAVLNRVLGHDPSAILGSLQSNGKVFLINPNGILFGAGSRVDVNGLVASTLDIADADFRAGRLQFQAGPKAGAVRNEGRIATPAGGRVYLLAPDVSNAGVIQAPDGDVVLAAGHSVQLVDGLDPDVRVVVSAPDDQAVNLGQVVATAGRIGIYGALVNQRGLLSADSAVRGANGKIVLKASRATTLEAGSLTSAAGSAGADGGSVHLLGESVELAGDARVDASGAAGGTVLAGGGYQGGGDLPHAQSVRLGADASIRADATGPGNGGQVVLWSDGGAKAAGTISARALGGGNGGAVETSGHVLEVDGIRVDTRAAAANAKQGSWLLDPYDIEVAAGGRATVDEVKNAANGSATGVSRIDPGTLTAAGADVVLQAQHDITITDTLNAAGKVSATAGHDINVNAQLKSSSGDIDLRAGNALRLGSLGSLLSNNYIDLRADQMTLAGGIGKAAGSQLPILSLSTSTASRAITVGSGTADTSMLWLDASTLSKLGSGLFELNLGNGSHTGSVIVAAPLTLAANLVLENKGGIEVSGAIDLSASADSRFIASLYGGAESLLRISAPVKASKSALLQGDRIALNGLLTVTNGGATLMPTNTTTAMSVGGSGSASGFSIGQAALANVKAASLTIGGLDGSTGGLTVAGTAALTATGGPSSLTLDAGLGALQVQAPLSVSGMLSLKTGLSIAEPGSGAIAAASLALRAGSSASLQGANAVGTLAAALTAGGGSGTANAPTLAFNNNGQLRVGSVDGIDGIAAGAAVSLGVSGGALVFDKDLSASGRVTLSAAGIGGSGTIGAGTLALSSTAGIGSATQPLKTAVATLQATNTGSGNQPINVANQGALVLNSAIQSGSANAGAIAIDSVGGLTVPVYSTAEGGAETGSIRTVSGDIKLVTHSPMTINGQIATTSGNVSLTADNGGQLTIASGASVVSGSGSVTVVAGSSSIPSGAISVSSPDKLSVTSTNTPAPAPPATPPAPPTLSQCQATPSLSGCTEIIQHDQIDQCTANPKLAGCSAVLPTYEACTAAPAGYGCAGVIAQHDAIGACLANPNGAACSATLPTYDACAATPTAYGCAPAIAQHDAVAACIANPSGAGCSNTLPAYATCSAAPATFGCAPVLAQHDAVAACIANPAGAGCAGTLPSYAACAAAPATFGCAPVIQQHDAVSACMANTKAAGCDATLPALQVCRGDASVYGCSAVLARAGFEACLANPSGAGCAGVLPSLALCKASTGLEGCSQVLELGFQACLARPNDASCGGILPTLAQCADNKTLRGCEAVLPTLDQCIGSPSLQGCGAILPSLAVCAQAPSTQGCQAVLPSATYCSAHPAEASCAPFTGAGAGGGGGTSDGQPASGSAVAQAVQDTVHVINTGTAQVAPQTASLPDSGSAGSGAAGGANKDGAAGPAQALTNGVINGKSAPKNYCN